MVLIRSYSEKTSHIKNSILLLISVFLDRFQGLRFLPIEIDITLAVLFFILMYSEESLPIWFVFFAGLLNDSLSGAPLGQSTFALLVFYMLIDQNKKFLTQSDLSIQWVYLGFCITVFELIVWFFSCLFSQTLLSIGPVFEASGKTFLVYPFIYLLLKKLIIKQRFR
ncbi:MAG: rod shape-determining protein MreD [Alphaproteobacteria bacterium]